MATGPFKTKMPGPQAVDYLNTLWNRVSEPVSATFTESITVGNGLIAITTEPDKPFDIGMVVRLTKTDDVNIWMTGPISQYNDATGATTILRQNHNGSGTYSNWVMTEAGNTGNPGLDGVDGWSPVFAMASDGARRVMQIADWVGGEGVKPATGGYVGATGIEALIANGVDVRGTPGGTGPANSLSVGTVTVGTAAAEITGTAPNQTLNLVLPAATPGEDGDDGDDGFDGWTPIFAVVSDGARRVLQVSDWVGGEGTKPTTGQYVGATGFETLIANGVDIRGPQGVSGNNGVGIVSVVRTSGTGAPGTADTYTITYTDASTSTFNVYNGENGSSAWADITGKPTDFPPSAHNQAISTITGLQAVLDEKVDKVGGKGLSTEDYSSAEKTKLGGIATGATVNSPDATLLARGNHTGSQAISTITGLQTALDSKAGGNTTDNIGYLNVPQNSQSTAYTAVLADNGKHLLHPSADTTARTFTIPANSSVAFPIGAALTFVNQNAAGVMTISITSDTMRLAGAGTTGNRTLAANGIATALKITSTEWIISGTGLT